LSRGGVTLSSSNQEEQGNHTMQVSTMLLAAALAMFGTQNMSGGADQAPTILPNCTINAIHDAPVPADLPAQQGGTLKSIAVKVGDPVKKGDVLATVDDELEKLSLEVSRQRLVMAQEEADNDVNVRYADAAAGVHNYRYQMVMSAVDKVPDAYSKSEVMTYLLQANQFVLQKEQAEHEQNLARISVRVREAENKLAEHELARREIKAPVDGVIEEVKQVVGDWVRAGDPIVRLVQMDRLKINGSLPYDPLTPAAVRGKPVTVKVRLAGGREQAFAGRVDSTGSVYGRGDFDIIVEVENQKGADGDWMLMPGMTATIEIHH
jgi:macrolide-specific efflux system membrane fusion protein